MPSFTVPAAIRLSYQARLYLLCQTARYHYNCPRSMCQFDECWDKTINLLLGIITINKQKGLTTQNWCMNILSLAFYSWAKFKRVSASLKCPFHPPPVIVYLSYQGIVVNYDDRLTNCYREGGAQVASLSSPRIPSIFRQGNKSRIQPAIYASNTYVLVLVRYTNAPCRSYLANHFHRTRTLADILHVKR